jgi:hypothetical protein
MGVRASFGPPIRVVPGQAASGELVVENTGVSSANVRIVLLGEPGEWGWATPATLTVPPGSTASATVTIKLPRASPPAPGRRTIVAAVVPVDDPAARVEAVGTLDVAPFVQLVATLRPHTSTGRTAGRHQLVVANQGNAPVTATAGGEGDDVSVRIDPGTLVIGPGQEVSADVVARLGGRGFRSGTAGRQFDVVVTDLTGTTLATTEAAAEFPAGALVRRLGAGIVVVALAAVAVAALLGGSGGNDDRAQPVTTEVLSNDCPGRDHLSPDANGIVRPGVALPFDYSFLFVSQDGCQPARFNPCAPIRYALNRAQATDADVADLNEALAKVTEATGLQFQFAGTSTDDPRGVSRPVRASDGSISWPPVLIGWSHLGTGEVLRPRTTGTTAPSAAGVVGGGGRPVVVDNVITTGNLVLNLDAVTDTDTHDPVPHGFGPGVNWGRIMMHELAHVIGLGHVGSRTSIMNETLTQQTISSAQWGVGDQIGLRHLGKEAGCLTVPSVQTTGIAPS